MIIGKMLLKWGIQEVKSNLFRCIHIKISRNFAVRSGEEDLSSIYMNDVSKSDHLIDIAGLSWVKAQEHTSLALCLAHPPRR